jgi:DNA-binding beta-propeller fold protein YncE
MPPPTIRSGPLRCLRTGFQNAPTGIVVGRDGVWVASDLDPYVSRIDPATNKVVDQLKVGGSVDGMAVDGDRKVLVTVHAQQG